ncbi:hypothetical protein DLAC_08131 [Tieghemostelium lacteum]|uniref:Uncharacterized protein n=1 Tax=Tieghemostelium lacteum TaxID=361077 RepID=A0A151ZB93_TIELA|nr:hypothetical protein DLAC_08131 [Tieghemostelium lacteum]|eukprot:KYQ91208.1 hypothetical protein DLAC_08131 [Tieghemostelium lacteum]
MDETFYDVVIIGGGIAGLAACRHLLLNIEQLQNKRIAIIEPRTANRTNVQEDYKVGESTIDVSSMFFAKELRLQDYLIENHPPKFSLQFNWPKKIDKTDTMEDYYSILSIKNPEIQTFQLNRAKIERDMLKMVINQGAVYYHGRVKDVNLTPGDSIKSITIHILSDTDDFNDQKVIDTKVIQAGYIIDASGRNFVVGSRTNNVVKDPKEMFGLENASTWVRVKNTNRDVLNFQNHEVTASWYYATNHFFGPGYWIWMIPLERGSRDFSIGVSYHRDKIDPKDMNSLEKFLNFLKVNQRLVYDLIVSGEIVDCHKWPKLAHTSRVFFSPDHWCVIGDAACIFDPFYSTGMAMMAFEVECCTELLKQKLVKKCKSSFDTRVEAYDGFIRCYTQNNCHIIKKHSNHLGNASVMSWRIYLENTIYFGTIVPMYIGKYFLCPKFCKFFLLFGREGMKLKEAILDTFDEIIQKDINIGFIDNHRGTSAPNTSWDVDNILNLSKYGEKVLNLPTQMTWTSMMNCRTFFYIYMKAYGIKALWNSSFYKTFGVSLLSIPLTYTASWIHYFKNWNTPDNEFFDKMVADFDQYKYVSKPLPF